MIAIKKTDSAENIEIFEFQGTFENIELFDGIFDSEQLLLRFPGFVLQGKRIAKELTIFEKIENTVYEVGRFSEVVLFDSPPRYNVSTARTDREA